MFVGVLPARFSTLKRQCSLAIFSYQDKGYRFRKLSKQLMIDFLIPIKQTE